MNVPSAPRLRILCSACGRTLEPLAQECPCCPGALPRSSYAETRFAPSDRGGIFRFSDWLPAAATVDTTIGPAVVRNPRLSEHLGMTDLSIVFSGYAPSLGARNMTGTFKDFEALPTLLYLRERGVERVVLASAGNTARAFAYAATLLDFPTIIVVPEAAVPTICIPTEPGPAIHLIAVAGSNDYSAAIRLANAVAEAFEIHAEGGARNVARRDGMGSALLEYARVERRLPDHYIQAVGSGTGAIAVWEAAVRLLASGGNFVAPLPQLHVAQNAPFTPIHDAWTAGADIEPERDIPGQLARIAQLTAPVLANRTPPYAAPGGLRDALRATLGHTYAVTNAEIDAARSVFQTAVGVPVGPEAGAALAALGQARARRWIGADDAVLLHVTGNGDALLGGDVPLRHVPIWQRVPADRDAALSSLERAGIHRQPAPFN